MYPIATPRLDFLKNPDGEQNTIRRSNLPIFMAAIQTFNV